jgi:hypothetical protein
VSLQSRWYSVLMRASLRTVQNQCSRCPSASARVITLIHKGGDKPEEQVSSLLNCDYTLLARVLVQRLTRTCR